MAATSEEDLSAKMSELYVAECSAAKARLEVESECRRIIADNYEKVLTEVKEHSKKLEVPTTAKICEVGYFCDAHLVRTNQVSMEMGAQYFVECSIHTAEKIVNRRVQEMRSTREDGLESIRILNDKISFAQENFAHVAIEGGPIEIVEKYDDEMERMFYENRRKRNQEREQNKKEEISATEEQKPGDKEHDEVMNRLEELEKLETENEEIGNKESEVSVPKPFEISVEELGKLVEIEEEAESPTDEELRFGMNERLLAQPGVSQKEMERLLEFLDACEESSDEEFEEEDEEEADEKGEQGTAMVTELDSDDYASDENDVEAAPKPSKNAESNTKKVQEVVEKREVVKVERKRSGVRFAEKLENVKTFLETDTVEMKEEVTVETKSILRSTEPTPVDPKALLPEHKELAAMSTATFPGEIVEKNPYDCEPSTSKDPAPVITEKKVSKFRASRHRN